MTRVRSILFECNCYSGDASNERCRAVEEHVMECVGDVCGLESVTMRELDMGGSVFRPTIEMVYSKGNYHSLIPKVDEALREIGIVAVKALVSSVVSHAVEGVVAGAGAGWLAGSVAARGARGSGGKAVAVLASMVIGAALGAAGGKMATERVLDFVATRHAGGWTIKKIPRVDR